MDNKLIKKSNRLIEANINLGLMEQKIVLTLISQINKEDQDFRTYEFNIKEFVDILGINMKDAYSRIPKITKGIMEKTIVIHEEDRILQTSFFSDVEYKKGSGTVEINISPKMKPYLLGLQKYFTTYELKNVLKLKSQYSIRIYELLKQYAYRIDKTRIIDVQELRNILGIPDDMYSRFTNFEQRIIKPAQKELQLQTDIFFKYEKIKKGKTIEKLKFTIGLLKETKEIELEHMFSDNAKKEIVDNLSFLKDEKFSLGQLLRLYDYAITSGTEEPYLYIELNYHYAKLNSNESLYGYLVKAVKNGYVGSN